MWIPTGPIRRVVGLAVTSPTARNSRDPLAAFYRRTRPSRAGWAPMAALAPDVQVTSSGLANLQDWIAACVLIYGVLFGTGKLLLHETGPGLILLALGVAGRFVPFRRPSLRGWASPVGPVR